MEVIPARAGVFLSSHNRDDRIHEQGEDWTIRWNKQTGLPRTIRNGKTKAYSGSAEAAARDFLSDHPELFAIKNLRNLRMQEISTNRYGLRRVTFQQHVSNVPVEGAQYGRTT